MSGEFDVLRRGEVSAKVEVRQIDGPKESIRRDNRVEKKIDAGKRSDVGGGGGRKTQGDHPQPYRVRGGQRQRRGSGGGPGWKGKKGTTFPLGRG